MFSRLIPLFALFGLVALLPAAGCNKAAPTPASAPPVSPPMTAPPQAPNVVAPPETPVQFAAARKTFDTHCQRCHSTEFGGGMQTFPGPDKGPPQDKKFGGFPGGPGGPRGFKGMMKGPNLAKVGADPKHTRDWLVSYIRNPQSQKPNARMPKFEGKIGDDDLGTLA